jgi:hypothetical protein
MAAGSGAESFKAFNGDAVKAVSVLGGVENYTGEPAVFFNDKWKPSDAEQAAYILRIIQVDDPESLLLLANVVVSRTDGEELFDLPVAVRGRDAR